MKASPNQVPAPVILAATLLLFAAIGIMYSCGGPEDSSGSGREAVAAKQFVGEQTCRSCHGKEAKAWDNSHHDYAMKPADSISVRGNFNNTTFTHKGDTYRFYRSGGRYMVEAPGAGGRQRSYEITHTFGWTPLQQYLVKFGKGKLQALNIAWDTKKKRWFALNPDQDIKHGDWLHWTGGAMNWNTMCASCHSTNLKQNYIASADSFHTTWSSINVSCESCHGPGKAHVDFVKSKQVDEATIERIRQDLKLTEGSSQRQQINQCAQCHALREKLTDNYTHQGKFLDHFNPTLPHPGSYYADGQIKEEVYVYGSFLQSKMFKNGVECADCHDPHSLELKANVTDNTLCLQCHKTRYDSPEHHFHEPNTEASQCVNCHMPGRYYMEIDFRRDHSFRVPRPDLSKKFGTPNACNNCHSQRPPAWAAKQIERWYGPDRPRHFSHALAKADSVGPQAMPELENLIADTTQPDIARATAVWYLGQFAARQSIGLLEQAVNDKSPLVRNSAARAAASLPQDLRTGVLQEAVDDSVGAVRLAAAEGLAEFSVADIPFNLKQPFKKAMGEYREYLDANRYFPQGQMNRGQFFEKQGEVEKAAEAYRKALRKDPHFNPARLNLAYLYNARGDNRRARELLQTVIQQEPAYGPAYYSLALLLAEEKQLKQSLPNFERAARLLPENHRIFYNWAIALQTLNKPDKAEKIYLRGIELAPENPAYRYGLCTLYIQQERYKAALPHVNKLEKLQPANPEVQQLVRMVNARLR